MPRSRRTCESGKVRFRDNIAARVAIAKIDQTGQDIVRNGMSVKPIRCYRCDLCDGWHLTSQSRRKAS